MLIADPALARNDRYIKFPKEVILKALDRTMETNSLLWYSINKEICDFIRFDEYLDDEEFLLEILKYEPYHINDCSKDKDFIIRSLEYNPDIYQYLSDSLKNDEDIVEKLIRSDPTYDLRVIPKEVREIVVNKLKEELRERLLKEKNYATSGFFEKLSIKKKIKEELRGNNWVKYFIKDSSNKSILGYIESPADYFDYSYSRIFDDYVNNDLNLDLLVLGENDLEEEEKIKEIKKVFSEAIKKNKDKFMEEFTNVTLQKNFYNYIHYYSNADNEEEQKAIIKASLDDSITSISNFIARYAIDINKTIKVEEKDEDDDQLTIYSEDKEKIKKIFSNPILLSYYLDKLEEFEDIKVSDIVDGSDDFIKEASNIIKEKCIRALEEMKTSQPKETTKIVTEEETVEVEKKEIKHKK